MINLSATATVLGVTVDLLAHIDAGEQPLQISDDAASRIYMILRREAQRMAEISGVDARDQVTAQAEAKRISEAPKDRPMIVAAAGTKDPESVMVLRGSFDVGGHAPEHPKRTVSAQAKGGQ